MATTPINRVIQQLRAACGRDPLTDGELVNRFLSQQDDVALAVLVRRGCTPSRRQQASRRRRGNRNPPRRTPSRRRRC
jgi:hypothetical protein